MYFFSSFSLWSKSKWIVGQNVLWYNQDPDTFLTPSSILLTPSYTFLVPYDTFMTPSATFLTQFDPFLTPSSDHLTNSWHQLMPSWNTITTSCWKHYVISLKFSSSINRSWQSANVLKVCNCFVRMKLSWQSATVLKV